MYNQFSKINSVQKISSGSIGRITKIMGYSTKIIIVPEVTVNLSVVSQILFYSYDWIGSYLVYDQIEKSRRSQILIMRYTTKIIIVPEVTGNLSVVSQILFYSYDWIGLDM